MPLFLLLLCLLTLPAAAEEAPRARSGEAYVLALSWSPAYCAEAEPGRSPLQCDSGRPYGFILHGLWPQLESGFHCQGEAPALPQELVLRMLDITPDAALVLHEWQAHGSCSGLGAEGYFALARQAFEAVRIPEAYRRPAAALYLPADAIEAAFLAADPRLSPESVLLLCDGGLLEEVRICLDAALQPTACARERERSCRQRDLEVLPVETGG